MGGLGVEPNDKFFRVIDTDTRKVIAGEFTMLYEAEDFIHKKLGLIGILKGLKYWEVE